MEERIKQRLIGVIVIVGALFIILPFLFHNSRPTLSQQASSNVPNPSTPSVSLTLPAAIPATTTPATVATPTSQDTASASAAAPTPSATPSTESATESNTETTVASTEATPATPAAPQVAQAASATPAAPATPNVAANNPSAANTPSNAPTTASNATPASNATSTASNTVVAANMPSNAASKASPAVKSAEFSGAPATSTALTTGQANEGPAQMQTTPAAAQSFDSTTPAVTTTAEAKPATPVQHTAHAAKPAHSHPAAKLAMHAKGEAWVIQLGVFSNKKNASHLISKLRAEHFEVYSHNVKQGQQSLMAVFVGPEMNLHKTELMQKQLKQQFQLNGVVKKYQA